MSVTHKELEDFAEQAAKLAGRLNPDGPHPGDIANYVDRGDADKPMKRRDLKLYNVEASLLNVVGAIKAYLEPSG